ncbi:putative trehalase [Carex littledalei]|uniref:alpha,alpha-trehalase n=1 Tax=Carex littledalei TaxID=544730 RepID=A0A833QLL2_9POAL|nr:putative trehalase [Carex littledalei]
MREWALEVHAIWKNLSRRVSDEVRSRPERHTLLYLPGTVIVPGLIFQEVYYWDSYWVIRQNSLSFTVASNRYEDVDKEAVIAEFIVNAAWKGFKTELVNRYVNTHKMPFDKYPWIETGVWDEFIAMKTSEAFRV